MNKQIFFFFAFAALIAGAGIAAEDKSAEPATAAEPSGDTRIATVNGEDISLDMFRYFYAERLRQTREANTPAIQNRVFNEFVNILVTAQDAKTKGLDKDSGFELASEIQRLQLLSSFAIQNAAQADKPSDEDLQKAYQDRYGKGKGTEYKARHILVTTEKEAKKLIDELKGGADFTELAKTHSKGPTGKDGGELPWFSAGQMVQPFVEATATLKPGEYSTTPVQTQYGWHVILLEDTREAEPPPFDKVKNELALALQQEALGAYIAGLREKADLKLNPDLIKETKEDKAKPGEAK